MDADGTLTRADIARAIAAELGIPIAHAKLLAIRVLELMSDALARGENVKISGFGTFHIHQCQERVGRNLRTLKPAVISARARLAFRPSRQMKDRVAGKL